jgi:hypothetical protein
LLPDHAPEAVHDVVLADDQLKVELLPEVIELGLALKLTVGAGFLIETVADWDALPPAPVQVNPYVEFSVSAPVDCEPLTDLLPDQAPEAEHDVALTEDHVSVALPPLAIALGPTLSVTVGAGDFTETVADWAALPPGPIQLKL